MRGYGVAVDHELLRDLHEHHEDVRHALARVCRGGHDRGVVAEVGRALEAPIESGVEPLVRVRVRVRLRMRVRVSLG